MVWVVPTKRNPNLFALVLSLALTQVSLCVRVFAQQIEIKLVDGRNGHPMLGKASYVNVWVGSERKDAIVVATDQDGIARLELTSDAARVNISPVSPDSGSIVMPNPVMQYNESLRINVPYALCISQGSSSSWLTIQHFSTKQILEQGYVSPNTCGKTSVPQKPGQIIIFARPLTWLERWKQ